MKIIHDYSETQTNGVIGITSARYVSKYVIEISFNDGTEKKVDFKSFLLKSLHPSISKYLDESLFQTFQIIDGNLNWNDYDLIFPIQDLHEGVVR
jgi:hypothetical protein